MPRPHISNPISLRVMPSSFCLSQRVAAHEIALVELHDPAEVGFQRRDGGVDFVAVKRHFGFQTQRVARAQSARLDAEFLAGLQDFVPQALGFGGRHVDFVAVLAGIAGVRDARRRARDFAVGEPVIVDARRDPRASVSAAWRARWDPGWRSARSRSLAKSTSASKRLLRADVLEILLLIGGVDAQEIVVVGDFVDQNVVDESAVLVKQPGVVRLAPSSSLAAWLVVTKSVSCARFRAA